MAGPACDLLQQCVVGGRHHAENAVAVAFEEAVELRSFAIKPPGTIDLEGHEPVESLVGRAPQQLLRRIATLPQLAQREIDPPSRHVFFEVAEDVGQLKGQTALPGRLKGLMAAEAPERRKEATRSPWKMRRVPRLTRDGCR